jgi:hypothetical protein
MTARTKPRQKRSDCRDSRPGVRRFGYFYTDYLNERAHILAMRDSPFNQGLLRDFKEHLGREVDKYNREIIGEVTKAPGVRSRRMGELFERSKLSH